MANDRDCENCIHKVNGACNVWECKFEPKEDVEAEEGGQGMTKEEKEAVLHCLRSMIDEELCEECPLYGTTGTDHCEKDCVRLAIEELEQDEYIKVPKKALKYRTAGIVAYNAEWLKNHFDIERAVICGVQEHYEDAISRQAVLDITWEEPSYTDAMNVLTEVRDKVKELPPVNPQKPICPSAGVDCEDCPAYEPKVLNKWIGAEVLDRIRNEMHATAEKHEDGVYYLRDEWIDEIIDKYKAEGSGEE